MRCFNCDYQRITKDMENCPVCGVGLSRTCKKCNSFNPSSAKFCFECGNELDNVKQDKLVKISNALKVEIEILNIQRIIGEAFSPKQMMERTTGLYLNDPTKGIYVFDNYGSFLRKIPELNISKFNVIENTIAFRQGNDINTLNTRTLEFNKI